MIWFQIALFVVSFLLTALLAPKPDIEDARAGSLEDVVFPRATEDAPIPLVLGKVRMNAPNTIWYGDWSTVAITERIRVSLFKKKTITVGHKYYMGLNLGLCLGEGVSLTQIQMDDETVWEGATSTTVASTGTISATELFGGYKEGGGWSGDFTMYPGTFDQPVSSYMEGILGADEVPAYRGLAHIVFHNNYIGESNQLRKMSFVMEKYTDGLGAVNDGRVGDDLNPMECMFQVVTNEWAGMGVTTAMIDYDSWQAAAQTLYDEGNGASVIVTSAQQGKTVIKELLRQIDAIMFQDPSSGKLMVKLIRSDYDVDDLLTFDEDDIIKVRNFTKTAWEDVVAQVKVSFPQRDKESSAVAISQDMATATMIGRLKTVTMSFPFCYDPDLANQIASRERSQQSVPLFQMTLEMNRNGYKLRPGDVFRVSWPEYGLSELVMRVQKHDLGELLNNKVVITCVQDAFAIGTTVFAAPVASGWVPASSYPQEIASWEILDLPTFFARNLEFPIAESFSQPYVLPLSPTNVSSGYSNYGGYSTGDYELIEPEDAIYPATGVLENDYDVDAGQLTGVDATGFTILSRVRTFTAAASEAEILTGQAGLLYVDGEWMGFLNVVQDSGATFTNVYRGLFGSPVKSHAAGTRVFEAEPSYFGEGQIGEDLATGSTWYYKLLDRVGSVQKDPVSLDEETFVAGDTIRKPLRPRNLQLTGTRNISKTNLVDEVATWSPTNRLTGTSYPLETAAAESPEETERYDMRVYVDGVEELSMRETALVTPSATVTFSDLDAPIESDIEIRVWARRADPLNAGDLNDLYSDGYASLLFPVTIVASRMLLTGDEQSGTDEMLFTGDEQSGTDVVKYSGDQG